MKRTIIKTTTKVCSQCGQEKIISEFNKNNRTKDKYHCYCKECNKQYNKQWQLNNPEKVKQFAKQWYNHNLEKHKQYGKQYHLNNPEKRKQYYIKRTYGLSLKQHAEMYKQQNHCCAICRRHKSEFTKGLAVDHHHPSNVNRGLLCMNCNSAIGKFKEDIGTICNAIYYLVERTPEGYFDIDKTISTMKTTIRKLEQLKI